MDRRIQKVFLSLAVLALTGCATEAHLRIHSQPEGAYISTVRSGQGLGMAPATIHYDEVYLERHRDADGCYTLDGVEARWASGAASSIEPVVVCGGDSDSYDVTLSRPSDYPDLDKDFGIALQLRETRAQEREAAAAMAQASAIEREARASERVAYEVAKARRDEERARREERDRRDRHDGDRDGNRDRDDHRDGNRNSGKMEMKPQVTIVQPASAPAPATTAAPAKPSDQPAYDPKDPKRPKGSKGWNGEE